MLLLNEPPIFANIAVALRLMRCSRLNVNISFP